MEGIVEFAFGGTEFNGYVPRFDGGECQNRVAGNARTKGDHGVRKKNVMDLCGVLNSKDSTLPVVVQGGLGSSQHDGRQQPTDPIQGYLLVSALGRPKVRRNGRGPKRLVTPRFVSQKGEQGIDIVQ